MKLGSVPEQQRYTYHERLAWLEDQAIRTELALDPDDVVARFGELMAEEVHLIMVRKSIDIFRTNRPLFAEEVMQLGRDVNDCLAIAYHECLEKNIAEGR